jgi:hypothetical protein
MANTAKALHIAPGTPTGQAVLVRGLRTTAVLAGIQLMQMVVTSGSKATQRQPFLADHSSDHSSDRSYIGTCYS